MDNPGNICIEKLGKLLFFLIFRMGLIVDVWVHFHGILLLVGCFDQEDLEIGFGNLINHPKSGVRILNFLDWLGNCGLEDWFAVEGSFGRISGKGFGGNG